MSRMSLELVNRISQLSGGGQTAWTVIGNPIQIKRPHLREEWGLVMACEPCPYLSSKAMTLTRAVDRAHSAMSGAYRCGTALDFDQLPLLSPVTGAPTVVCSVFNGARCT